MNKQKRIVKIIKCFLGTFIFVSLNGCNFCNKEKTEEKTEIGVILIDEKPVLYQKEFENSLVNLLSQSNPYYKGEVALESIPKNLKQDLLQGIIEQKLILAWCEKNKVDQNLEFIKKYEEAVSENSKIIKQYLMIEAFQKMIGEKILVSSQEVDSAYEKNKDNLLKFAFDTNFAVFKFKNNKEAGNFIQILKSGPETLDAVEKLAQTDKNITFKFITKLEKDTNLDFAPKGIKDFAQSSFKKKPSLEWIMFLEQDTAWLAFAGEKTEKVQASLEEVRDKLEQAIRQQKIQMELSKEIEELKKQFKVEVKAEFLNKEKLLKI